MKKTSKLTKAAAALAVLALGTSCFVGGTFAKYTTSKSGSDSARVAAFGVTLTADGSTFADTYAKDDTTAKSTIVNSVVSTDKADVVAPGTKGDVAMVTISGTPEVAVKVTYELDNFVLTGWELADDTFYCPIVIKVGETEIAGSDYTSADDFKAAIKAEIEDETAQYPPNTKLDDEDYVDITWSWPFETGSTAAEKAENDVKDTYLGNQAAEGNASEIELSIKTTVTQID